MSNNNSDKPSGNRKSRTIKTVITTIICCVAFGSLAFVYAYYGHGGVDTLVQPSEAQKLIYPAPNMTSHQIHCEYLFETISNKAELNDSLNSQGNKMIRVMYVMGALLDQQVNGTNNPMLTEFKTNCLDDKGINP